ncbi:hypothetical protein RIF29_01941 [Crotalaria pallida]|uniref:Uncharacterized protein n=1 Tax=Crotalaria pallida TaxID=3830 RepID=A0AAN9IYK7_CROPI
MTFQEDRDVRRKEYDGGSKRLRWFDPVVVYLARLRKLNGWDGMGSKGCVQRVVVFAVTCATRIVGPLFYVIC